MTTVIRIAAPRNQGCFAGSLGLVDSFGGSTLGSCKLLGTCPDCDESGHVRVVVVSVSLTLSLNRRRLGSRILDNLELAGFRPELR